MPDGGTASGGGGVGGMLPLLLAGGSTSGISPLLLFLLLNQSHACSSSSSSTDTDDPSTFADVLTANIGRRVRLVLGGNSLIGGPSWVIIATIVAVNTDYVVLENICINGRPEPVLSRLRLLTSQILGIHALTTADEFVQLSCVLGSTLF